MKPSFIEGENQLFDEKFSGIFDHISTINGDGKGNHVQTTPDEIKNFLRESHLRLLEHLRERVEGMKEHNKIKSSPTWDAAISDILSLLSPKEKD